MQHISWWMDISAWVIPVLLAVTLHEAAHGYAALRFGDTTARKQGRVSLNPFKHVDPVGTILLPALLLLMRAPVIFGYAKPVPVNFHALHPRRLGSFCVALAGPATNIALAVASALLLHLEPFISPAQAPWLYLNLYRSLIINCVLAVFNMVPVLPLDGGRVLHALLPPPLAALFARTERFGMILILALLFVPPLFGISFLLESVGVLAFGVMEFLLYATGNGTRLAGA